MTRYRVKADVIVWANSEGEAVEVAASAMVFRDEKRKSGTALSGCDSCSVEVTACPSGGGNPR